MNLPLTKLKFLSALMLVSVSAFAHPGMGPKPPGPDGCEKFKFSTEQEKSIKADHLAYADKIIDLEAAVEHAQINFEKIVADEKSDAKAISSAGQMVAETLAKKIAADEELKASIIGKLKPAQRSEALQCGMMRDFHGGYGMHPHHPGMPPNHPGFENPHDH